MHATCNMQLHPVTVTATVTVTVTVTVTCCHCHPASCKLQAASCKVQVSVRMGNESNQAIIMTGRPVNAICNMSMKYIYLISDLYSLFIFMFAYMFHYCYCYAYYKLQYHLAQKARSQTTSNTQRHETNEHVLEAPAAPPPSSTAHQSTPQTKL